MNGAICICIILRSVFYSYLTRLCSVSISPSVHLWGAPSLRGLLLLAVHAVLLLQVSEFLLPPCTRNLSRLHSCFVVVEHNQVPIRNVEAGEVVYRVFRVEDILVHNESSSLRVSRITQSDLSYGPVLAEDIVQLLALNIEWQVTNIKHSVHFRRQPCVSPLGRDGRHSLCLCLWASPM